ncbi:hypothetical protein ACFE04_001524 [Oxalis oulophora]
MASSGHSEKNTRAGAACDATPIGEEITQESFYSGCYERLTGFLFFEEFSDAVVMDNESETEGGTSNVLKMDDNIKANDDQMVFFVIIFRRTSSNLYSLETDSHLPNPKRLSKPLYERSDYTFVPMLWTRLKK